MGDPFFSPTHDTFFQDTVNPEDLQQRVGASLEELDISGSNSHFYPDITAHDSGVDLHAQWDDSLKQESFSLFDNLFPTDGSSMAANTPSPDTDAIISGSNSPADCIRHRGSVASPDATGPVPKKETEVPEQADGWDSTYPTDAILIPQQPEVPRIHLTQDKTKTRAETQIKMNLIIDPLDNVEHIRFPRKALAKPKHFASEEEQQEIEAKGRVLHMDVHLICAIANEKDPGYEKAKRRAAGAEDILRRPQAVAIADLDKGDPSHPQNGGEVVICDGCKERERKRYDRKKKRGEDEEEFSKYENDRVIMINEKEYKKVKEVDGDFQSLSRARQVEFAMRIACYCRHQEEKSPQGYRVIFTFTLGKSILGQHVSDVFHITDDHKNRELTNEMMPPRLAIPQPYTSYHHQSNVVVPMFQYRDDYTASYAQPTTEIVSSQSTSPLAHMDPNFSHSLPPMAQPMATVPQQVRHPQLTYGPPASANVATYVRHQRGQSFFDVPFLSPTSPTWNEPNGLPRPQSFDNFNFSYSQHDTIFGQAQPGHFYSSAPPSAGGTPVNLSRPASPTWEQGMSKKGKVIRHSHISGP